MESKNLADTFAVIKPDLSVDRVAVTPELYARLDSDYGGFTGHTLVSMHEFTEDWPTWERHPAGDEIVMLLAGGATFLLALPDETRPIVLDEPGSYIVVPRNTWHTARVPGSARVLFITPGEGTENREDDPV